MCNGLQKFVRAVRETRSHDLPFWGMVAAGMPFALGKELAQETKRLLGLPPRR